jgi:hypothetical protein
MDTIEISEKTEEKPQDSPDLNLHEAVDKESDQFTVIDTTPEQDRLMELDDKPIRKLESESDELTRLLRALPGLSTVQIRILELRYLSLLKSYKFRIHYIDFFHHFTRLFISLGSVAVPALLSIQSPTSDKSIELYWTTWALSLSVTCLHNFVSIFRFDKKFFAVHSTYEKLQSEGWSYLQLSGRYSGINGYPHNPPHQIKPTHQNQFGLFVHTIEKIQQKQISDEYNGKSEERPQGQAISANPFRSPIPHKNSLSPEYTLSPIKKI